MTIYKKELIAGGTSVCTQIRKKRMISLTRMVRKATRLSASHMGLRLWLVFVFDEVEEERLKSVGFVAQTLHPNVLLRQLFK